jgi:hypothetical protein
MAPRATGTRARGRDGPRTHSAADVRRIDRAINTKPAQDGTGQR